jgi:hypothetical protein
MLSANCNDRIRARAKNLQIFTKQLIEEKKEKGLEFFWGA